MIALARSGGPRDLGVFQFALTLTSLLPYYWGYPALLAREVARRPERAKMWVQSGMLTAIAFGAAFTGLLVVGCRIVGASNESTMVIGLASLGMLFDGVARVHFAAYVAWERMRLETIATAIQEAMFLGGTLVALARGGGPREAVIAFMASRAVGAAIAWVISSRRMGYVLVPRLHGGFARRAGRDATPFAVSDTLALIQQRADAVMLGFMKGPSAVGLYQACTNLVMYWNVLARSLNHALYPRMSRAWPARAAQFDRVRNTASRTLALIGVPVAVGGLLLAPEILRVLYGRRFDQAILAFRLLVVVVPIRMLGNTMSLTLAAADRQMSRVVAIGTGAAANVILNVILIPRWSYVGSAAATLATETGLLCAFALLSRRVAGPSQIVRAISLPVLACAPLAALVLATADAPLVISMGVGAAGYAAVLFVVALAKVRKQNASISAALAGLVSSA